jgi:hypothetical protein
MGHRVGVSPEAVKTPRKQDAPRANCSLGARSCMEVIHAGRYYRCRETGYTGLSWYSSEAGSGSQLVTKVTVPSTTQNRMNQMAEAVCTISVESMNPAARASASPIIRMVHRSPVPGLPVASFAEVAFCMFVLHEPPCTKILDTLPDAYTRHALP